METPYGIGNHLRELFEAELAVSVLVGFHDSLIHDLLQLRVLPTRPSTQTRRAFPRKNRRTLRLLPTIIFNTRNSSPLEMNPSLSIS